MKNIGNNFDNSLHKISRIYFLEKKKLGQLCAMIYKGITGTKDVRMLRGGCGTAGSVNGLLLGMRRR